MVRKTKADAQATRDLILDKAEQVFEQRGVSRTSLQDIAAAAGVTRGAIYWHFKDKADLFQAMMERVELPCEARVNAVFSQAEAGQYPSAFLELGLWVLQRLAQDAPTQRVFTIAMHRTELTDELGSVRERRLQAIGAFLADMRQRLEEAAAAGSLVKGVTPEAAAMGYFCLIDGLMYNWTLTPHRFDIETIGRQSLEAYLRGIFVVPAPV